MKKKRDKGKADQSSKEAKLPFENIVDALLQVPPEKTKKARKKSKKGEEK